METKATKPRTRKPYDPGQPKEVKHLGGSQFAVQSFRSPDEWYSVDLTAGTCTCPHFEKRVDPALDAGEEIDLCKHFQLATDKKLQMVREKAEALTAAQLRMTLRKYSYRPEVEGTIREVLTGKLLSLVQAAGEQVRSRDYCRV